MAQRDELLRRAADCFLRANADDEAIQCLVLLDDRRRLGYAFERAGRYSDAAQCFEQVREWSSAARCWLRAQQPAAAGRCMLESGDILPAAWILSHEARQAAAARAALSRFSPQNGTEHALVALCEAQCDLIEGRREAAILGLRGVITRMAELAHGHIGSGIIDWAMRLSADLARPDLTALLHAVCSRIELPGASERWRVWAEHELHNTMGVPQANV